MYIFIITLDLLLRWQNKVTQLGTNCAKLEPAHIYCYVN